MKLRTTYYCILINFTIRVLYVSANVNHYVDLFHTVLEKRQNTHNYRSLANDTVNNASSAIPEDPKLLKSISLADVEEFVENTDSLTLKNLIMTYLNQSINKEDAGQEESRRYTGDKVEPDLKVFGKEERFKNHTKQEINETSINTEIKHEIPVWNADTVRRDKEPSRRIMRGYDTSINHYGFMVSIHRRDKFWCAGVLIRKDFVLTTASCLQYEYNNRFYKERPMLITVRAGCNFTDPEDKKEDDYSRRVARAIKQDKKRKVVGTPTVNSNKATVKGKKVNVKKIPKRNSPKKPDKIKATAAHSKKHSGIKKPVTLNKNVEPTSKQTSTTKTTKAPATTVLQTTGEPTGEETKPTEGEGTKPTKGEESKPTKDEESKPTESDVTTSQNVSVAMKALNVTTDTVTTDEVETISTTDKSTMVEDSSNDDEFIQNLTDESVDTFENSTGSDSLLRQQSTSRERTNNRTSCHQFRALEFFFHPAYEPTTLSFNFALIRLEYRYVYAYNHTMLIELPEDSAVPVTATVFVLGWGSNAANGDMKIRKKRLQMALLPVYSNSECAERYGKEFIHPNMFCAGTITERTAGCNHDLGGAAVNRRHLVGLFSSGPMFCGEVDSPNVFSRAGAAKSWVERTIASVPRNAIVKKPKEESSSKDNDKMDDTE